MKNRIKFIFSMIILCCLCLLPSPSFAYDYFINIVTINEVASDTAIARNYGGLNVSATNSAHIESSSTSTVGTVTYTNTGMFKTPSLTVIKNIADLSLSWKGFDVTTQDMDVKIKNTTSNDFSIELIDLAGGKTLSLDLREGNLGVEEINATGLGTLRLIPPAGIAPNDVVLFIEDDVDLDQASLVLDSFENFTTLNPGATFALLKARNSLTPPSSLTSPQITSLGEQFIISYNGTDKSIEATFLTGTTDINPTAATFDKLTPADIDITITYHGVVTLADLVCNGHTLNPLTEYEISGNTITIKKDYLATLANSNYQLEFQTSVGRKPVLNLTVKKSTPAPDPGESTVSVTKVELSNTTLSLITGDTATLTAIITPSNATDKSVKWESSDADVATVDRYGKITAVGPGICTITVTTTSGNKKAVCTVTVTDPVGPEPTQAAIDFSGLGLEEGILKLQPGDAVDLMISATPAGTAFTAERLPDGLTLTSDGHLSGTVPEEGTYTVTITATAPDGTTVAKTFVIEVKADEVIWSSNGGNGCDAGFGLAVLLAMGLVVKRRK